MNLKYLAYLLLACVAFFLLCNPLPLYFLSDDFDSMYMAQQWTGVIHSYRPGSDFLLHTDHLLYGYDASGYHITNYLLHFAACFMLFYTAKALLNPFYKKILTDQYAFTASLVFLFYPFHSEPIFWLVGRSSLLAVLFGLGSIYFFLRKAENKVYYIFSLLCLVLGLFSYESIWTLPVIIILLSFNYDKTIDTTGKLLYIAGYWFTFFTYLTARYYLTTTVIGSPYGTQKIVSFDFLFLARNFAGLVGRSFLPPMQSATLFVVCLAGLALLFAPIVFLIRKQITTPLIICSVAFVICLLPVISLGIDTHDTESERFLYLPSAFLSIVLSILLFIIFNKKAFYAVVSFLGIQSVWLVISYQSFAVAGTITRTSVKAIQSLSNTDTVYCVNIPGQYKGGFIFRNGFASAAKLLAPKVKNVMINQYNEISRPPEKYALKYYPLTYLPAHDQVNYSLKNADVRVAVFVWTDSSLNVYR